jgi:hypothetical protein
LSTTQEPDYDDATEATYRAIGRFIDQFASVEWTLRFYLTQAVKLDLGYMTTIITHDFALLCTAVASVYSNILKTEEDKKLLNKLISQCRAMNDTRVKVVHGQWFPFAEGGMVAHRSRQNLKLEDMTGMAAFLEKQSQEGVSLFADLQVLLAKFEDRSGDAVTSRIFDQCQTSAKHHQ